MPEYPITSPAIWTGSHAESRIALAVKNRLNEMDSIPISAGRLNCNAQCLSLQRALKADFQLAGIVASEPALVAASSSSSSSSSSAVSASPSSSTDSAASSSMARSGSSENSFVLLTKGAYIDVIRTDQSRPGGRAATWHVGLIAGYRQNKSTSLWLIDLTHTQFDLKGEYQYTAPTDPELKYHQELNSMSPIILMCRGSYEDVLSLWKQTLMRKPYVQSCENARHVDELDSQG